MATDLPVVSYKNIVKVIEDVRSLHHDARLLLAGNLLRRVDEYLSQATDRDRKEIKAAVKLLEGKNKGNFDDLRRRAAECISTLRDWHSADWIVAQTFMGITTSYKNEPDGSLWVKLHGTMDNVRVIDQLAMVREVDLFRHWVPFCDKSILLKRVGIVEVLAHFNTAVMGISRDCVLHAYGCDAVLEEKCILIQGRSVEEWDGVNVPKVEGWRNGRLDVKAFRAKIEVLSPTSSSTSIVANVDPKTPLPKAVVNFAMRKCAGMLLYCLQKAARRITADEDSRHRSRILEDEFYKRWLLPRIERFYLKMGWRFDNSFALQSITSAPEVQRRQDMTLDITTSESRRCCTLRDVKENRIKRALGRFRRKRNRDTLEAVVTKELQVDGLNIDPRLLQKWRARREARLRGDPQPGTSSLRLLVYVTVAVCAAIGSNVCSSLRTRAYRWRIWFSAFCLAGFLYAAKEYT